MGNAKKAEKYLKEFEIVLLQETWVMVGLKKGLIYEEAEECKYGIVVKGLESKKKNKINIIAIHNNGKIQDVAGELKEVTDEIIKKGETMILEGDWNARVGRWKINKGEIVEQKNSVDMVTNSEGKKLLKLCKEIGGIIENGEVDGDWDGRETYIGNESNSVLDMVIEIENEGGSIVDRVKIRPRIESDHLPIEIYLKGRKINGKEKVKKKRKKNTD